MTERALGYAFDTAIEQAERPELYLVPEPAVRLARDAGYELASRRQFKQWLGELSVPMAVEVDSAEAEEARHVDLLERLHKARSGDPEAERSVRLNVAKAVAEGFFKDNFVTRVWLERTATGDLIQHGQTTASVHRNAITMRPGRHQTLAEITKVEALNSHRIGDYLDAGELQDNYFIVPSIVPADVPEKDLGHEGDGYFLESLTFVIQATTEQPDGLVSTDSAFMAGVESDGHDTFDERLSKRFDIAALTKVYERLGQKAPTTARGFLNSGLLVPKELMPNGIVDFMRWVHEATDELLGRTVERRPEDYLALPEESKRKETSVAPVGQKVYDDLQRALDMFGTAMDASKLMWQLVKDHGLEEAFHNDDIDPMVFGRQAGASVKNVREYTKSHNYQMAQFYSRKAHEEATMSGCGGGSGGSGGSGSANREKNGEKAQEEDLEAIAGSDKYGSRAFRCSNGHLNVRPKNELIENCQHSGCKAVVACK